jgi:hypothetical protein
VVKFDKSNHVHVWDHSYSTTTSIQSVEQNCTHDHSYYVKNTSVTKNCTHDHSYVKNTSVTKIHVIDPLCIICTREIATMEWAIIFYIHNR